MNWLDENYKEIQGMAQKITKGSPEWEDLAHYTIIQFMERDDVDLLIEKGQALRLMSGIMWRSFHSGSSPYHTLCRQKGRVHGIPEGLQIGEEDGYDYEQDLVVSQIHRIIENMKKGDVEVWYRATLFELYLKENNYSEISRQTGIPRTSISVAVTEAIEYIKEELIKSGITWKP